MKLHLKESHSVINEDAVNILVKSAQNLQIMSTTTTTTSEDLNDKSESYNPSQKQEKSKFNNLKIIFPKKNIKPAC